MLRCGPVLQVCESEAEGELAGAADSASGVLEGLGPHPAGLGLHSSLPPASDAGSADLQLDSVSAIITARQFSRRHSASAGRGVTFVGDGVEVADHVALTLDDDGEEDEEDEEEEEEGEAAPDSPFSYEEGQVPSSGGPESDGHSASGVGSESGSPVLAAVHQPRHPNAPHPQRRGRRRRASSAEGKASRGAAVVAADRPARCESFPKLETQ